MEVQFYCIDTNVSAQMSKPCPLNNFSSIFRILKSNPFSSWPNHFRRKFRYQIQKTYANLENRSEDLEVIWKKKTVGRRENLSRIVRISLYTKVVHYDSTSLKYDVRCTALKVHQTIRIMADGNLDYEINLVSIIFKFGQKRFN